jgi:hypothetical protein
MPCRLKMLCVDAQIRRQPCQPPRTRPKGFAPYIIAIALENPPSSSIPSLAPSCARNQKRRRGEIHSPVAHRPRPPAQPGCHLPSRNQNAALPMPYFATASCVVVGGIDRLSCGAISSSKDSRCVSHVP